MKTCPTMQRVIGQLAEKHDLDLTKTGAHLRLDMPGYDRLCIEVLGETKLSVAHYYDVQGYLIPEPDIVFYTGDAEGWAPLEITHSVTGCLTYVSLSIISHDRVAVVWINESRQADLAAFCEQWAQNLLEQGWLEVGVKHGRPARPNHRFGLGMTVITPGAADALATANVSPQSLLDRHVVGDWGDLETFDREQNERAVAHGGRLLSAYTIAERVRVWVITESDRSATTLLLPSEY